MLRSIWNSSSGLNATQSKIDIISTNLANVNTNGYKEMDVNFSDIVQESINRLGVPISKESKGGSVGSGVRVNGVVRNNIQGILKQTGRNLDLAIAGDGYFRLIGKDGKYLYTRNGSFLIDSENTIIDSNGYKLDIEYNEGVDSKILNKESLVVLENGNIMDGEKVIGKIKIYTFKSEDDLIAVGNGVYEGVREIEINSSIKQGYLEGSNVDLGKELTDLIVAQRSFELNSRALKTSDEMWQMINNLR